MKRTPMLWLPVLLVFQASVAHGAPLQAGAARVEITPPVGHPLWGYASRHDQPSVGSHPLAGSEKRGPEHAEADLFEGRWTVLTPTDATDPAALQRVRESAGVEHLFLVASHTHHGPILELDTWPKEGKPYTAQLEDRIVQAIAEAAKALQPARLGTATIEVELNRNRHSKRKDREPRDRSFIVVRLDDARGQPIAHLVNFAAHPTMTIARSREISADFPGALSRLVEKEAGGFCLFLQGAEGDLSTNPTGETSPEKFGEELGRLVLAQSKNIRCEMAEVSDLKARERDFTFGSRVDLANPLIRAAYSLAFFPEFVSFYEREYRDGIRPHLTTALLDGRIGFVGVSGEFFCEHANHLRRRAGLETLLFFGCCNDYQQYFPTIEAAAAGGYGADSTMSPAEIGAGERMLDQALIDLLQLQGKLRK